MIKAQYRPEEAMELYHLTLKKATNRKYAVLGKKKASELL